MLERKAMTKAESFKGIVKSYIYVVPSKVRDICLHDSTGRYTKSGIPTRVFDKSGMGFSRARIIGGDFRMCGCTVSHIAEYRSTG